MAKKKEVSGSWKNWLLGILVVLAVVALVFAFSGKDVRNSPADDEPSASCKSNSVEECRGKNFGDQCTYVSNFAGGRTIIGECVNPQDADRDGINDNLYGSSPTFTGSCACYAVPSTTPDSEEPAEEPAVE